MAVVHVKRGSPSAMELEVGLSKSFQLEWEWKVKELASDRFLVRLPSVDLLERLQSFDEFTLKGNGISIAVTMWSSATLAKAKLHSLWIKITGIPDDLMHYKGICEAGSPLGVVQEVDMVSLLKFSLARVRIGIRDPGSVPPFAKITTDPYIYDAYYEVESVAEVGGLLDQEGNVIGLVRNGDVSAGNDRDPKRTKVVQDPSSSLENPVIVEEGEGFDGKEGGSLSEDMEKMIQAELDRRFAVQFQQMEERAFAMALAKLQQQQNSKQIIPEDEAVNRTDEDEVEDVGEGKDQDIDEVDYESSQDLQDRVNKAFNGEDPNAKKSKTKAVAKDIHLKLRPQGDGTILDKAKELASKKNLNLKENKGSKSATARS